MISNLGRVRVKKQIEDLDRADRITAHIPRYEDCTASGCGFDQKTRTARNVACPVCSGKGRTETWLHGYFSVRVAWTDVGRPRFGGTVTTEELGDCTVTSRLQNKSLLETVRDSENAYLLVDGRRLRVMSVDIARVEGATSVVARCEIVRE